MFFCVGPRRDRKTESPRTRTQNQSNDTSNDEARKWRVDAALPLLFFAVWRRGRRFFGWGTMKKEKQGAEEEGVVLSSSGARGSRARKPAGRAQRRARATKALYKEPRAGARGEGVLLAQAWPRRPLSLPSFLWTQIWGFCAKQRALHTPAMDWWWHASRLGGGGGRKVSCCWSAAVVPGGQIVRARPPPTNGRQSKKRACENFLDQQKGRDTTCPFFPSQ